MLKSKNYNSCTYIEQINSKVRGDFFTGLKSVAYMNINMYLFITKHFTHVKVWKLLPFSV